MKKISILGSTGSIGVQALDVISNEETDAEVVALSANTNVKVLEEQIRRFNPKIACITDESKYNDLKAQTKDLSVKIVCGKEGLIETATVKEADTVLNSVVGIAGLLPTVSAIKEKKNIALANKETLVTGGKIVMELAKEYGVDILPVDSEHSAIFQCLNGENKKKIKNIWLTASGGPFRGKKRDELALVTKEQALKHPNWSMGAKITVDSATLMNKGLEIIEAKWLFDVPVKNILPVIHPESVIHSMVEFTDNSIIAQLGSADMRLPISYALNYPLRKTGIAKPLDFYQISKLTFDKPDTDTFKCLDLAIKAIETGGLLPTVLNGANEAAVDLFLHDKIKFNDISDFVSKTMESYKENLTVNIENILYADKTARDYVYSLI